MAVAARRGRPRARADRELAGGRGHRDARRAGLATRRDVAIVGEAVLADPQLPDRPRARSRSTRSRSVVSHPQPLGAVRALPARRAAAAPRCARPTSTAEAVRTRRRARRAVGGARARAAPPSATAAACCARASTTSPTTRRASSGSAPPGSAAVEPDGAGAVEDVGRLRRRGRRAAGLARALPVGVRLPRREPHARSSRARGAGASATTSSTSTWRAAPTSRRSPTRSSALRRALRGGPAAGHLSGGLSRPTCPRRSSTLPPQNAPWGG